MATAGCNIQTNGDVYWISGRTGVYTQDPLFSTPRATSFDALNNSTTMTYDALNRQVSTQDPTGGINTTSYDAADNVTQTTDPLNHSTSYGFDGLNGGATTSYSYDATDQLTQVVVGNSGGSTNYSYDLAGNRTMTGYQTGSGNEMLNDGTWTYTYDSEGNLIKKSKGSNAETWTFGYDDRNQLLWAKDASTDGGTATLLATYTYDVWGNRIEKDVWQSGGSTTTTKFGYDTSNAAPTSPLREPWNIAT
jgi:YD repeat-containing protein